MIEYTTVIETQMGPDDAFAYVSDLAKFEQWDPGTKRSVQVKGTEPGLGAEYDLKVGRLSLHYVVEEFDEPRVVVAHGSHALVGSDDTVIVEANGTGSRVTYHAELKPVGPLRVLSPLIDRSFHRMGDEAAEGLARALNGRRSNIHL